MKTILASLMLLSPLVLAPTSALAQDTDRDGVLDLHDAFPSDPSAAIQAFAPATASPSGADEDGAPVDETPAEDAEGASARPALPLSVEHGTVLIDDGWPRAGDRDYNDVVLRYFASAKQTSTGETTALRVLVAAVALGGDFDPSAVLRLPVDRALVRSASLVVGTGAERPVEPWAREAQATFDLAGSLRDLLGGSAYNVEAGGAAGAPVSIALDVDFVRPVRLDFSAAPFDLFVHPRAEPAREIHRPGHRPTFRGSRRLASSGGTTTYTHRDGFPAMFVVPVSSHHPAERSSLTDLYPRVGEFVASGGRRFPDFYRYPVINHTPGDLVAATTAKLPFWEAVTLIPNGTRRTCDVDFDNAFSLLLLPNTAVDTFAQDPFWIEPCWYAIAVRVGSTNYNHFHASYENFDPCVNLGNGTYGKPDGNGNCGPILDPHLEPRYLSTHAGNHVIRVWASDHGQPVPFDLHGLTVTGAPQGVQVQYRTAYSTWITTTVGAGSSQLGLKAVVEVRLENLGPGSMNIHELRASVYVP